ncbi:MAG: glycosyltransferase family 8 protein [Pseudomonadota bacterium]
MAANPNSITIASTIDKNYLVPLGVTAHSLLNSKESASRIDWFVFESGIPHAARTEFEHFFEGSDITFHWIPCSQTRLGNLPLWGRAVPVMYQRLVIADFFPVDLKTILYLDADLLVLGDVEELFAVDLGDMAVGAVQDMAIPTVSSPLGLSRWKAMGVPADARYFNAGVLLMNLAVWRKECISDRMLSYLETASTVAMMDQDALNALLYLSWKPLHYRWNVIGSMAGRRFFKPKDLDPKQYIEAVENPGIVHFGGYLKPWVISRLGNRWDVRYKHFLSRQGIGSAYDTGLKSTLYSLYDRHFRQIGYPLERAVWSRLREF